MSGHGIIDGPVSYSIESYDSLKDSLPRRFSPAYSSRLPRQSSSPENVIATEGGGANSSRSDSIAMGMNIEPKMMKPPKNTGIHCIGCRIVGRHRYVIASPSVSLTIVDPEGGSGVTVDEYLLANAWHHRTAGVMHEFKFGPDPPLRFNVLILIMASSLS